MAPRHGDLDGAALALFVYSPPGTPLGHVLHALDAFHPVSAGGGASAAFNPAWRPGPRVHLGRERARCRSRGRLLLQQLEFLPV